jgi:hypothetical protein
MNQQNNEQTEDGRQLLIEITELTSNKDASFSLTSNSLKLDISTNLESPKDDAKITLTKTFEF